MLDADVFDGIVDQDSQKSNRTRMRRIHDHKLNHNKKSRAYRCATEA